MIKSIVCCDKHWAIGKDNKLLFKLPTDMKYFKEHTKRKIVFVGNNTLNSFPEGAPLKERSTICLCSKEHNRDDCFCINDFDVALKLLLELSKTQDIYVIGGASIYKAMLPYSDIVYVTKVDADGHGNVFFPNLDEDDNFKLADTSINFIDNELSIKFCIYVRISNNSKDD